MDATASELWRAIGATLALAMREAPGFEARLTPSAWLVLTGEPLAAYNWALVDAGPDPETQLRAVEEVRRVRALPALVFLTDPVADRLAPTAAALGLRQSGRVPLMTYRPDDAVVDPPGSVASLQRYRVERVADAAGLAAANRLVAAAFGLPPAVLGRVLPPPALGTPGLAVFLAREAGEPVSTALTLRLGASVGVWNMATAPSRQRRGAGAAVLAHALAHHRTAGAELFYLWSTSAGRPLYERVGFRALAEAAVWVGGDADPAEGR